MIDRPNSRCPSRSKPGSVANAAPSRSDAAARNRATCAQSTRPEPRPSQPRGGDVSTGPSARRGHPAESHEWSRLRVRRRSSRRAGPPVTCWPSSEVARERSPAEPLGSAHRPRPPDGHLRSAGLVPWSGRAATGKPIGPDRGRLMPVRPSRRRSGTAAAGPTRRPLGSRGRRRRALTVTAVPPNRQPATRPRPSAVPRIAVQAVRRLCTYADAWNRRGGWAPLLNTAAPWSDQAIDASYRHPSTSATSRAEYGRPGPTNNKPEPIGGADPVETGPARALPTTGPLTLPPDPIAPPTTIRSAACSNGSGEPARPSRPASTTTS